MLIEISKHLNKKSFDKFSLHNTIEKTIEFVYTRVTGKPPLAINKHYYEIYF